MGIIEFVLNPVRYVLGQTMRSVFEQEVRSNPIIVHAEAQADDVGTTGGGVGQKYDGTGVGRKRGSGGGYRPSKESKEGFKPQYVVPLRKPRNDIEAQRLYNHIRTLAFYLDAIPILGRKLPFNIGFDSIIGLIPGVGDYIGLMVSLYALALMALFGLPIALIAMMSFNVLLDCTLGLIPIVGDAFDVAFHANLRNLRLLEDHLIRQDGKCGSGQFQLFIPPSDIFMPKNGSQDYFSNSAIPSNSFSSRVEPNNGLTRKRATKGESGTILDGTQKQSWTWTEGDSPTMPGGGRIDENLTGGKSDFRKGTMADIQQNGEIDQKSILSWSIAVVPTEIFTTMRYEPKGLSVKEMCEPILKVLNSSKGNDLRTESQIVPLWKRHMKRLKDSIERMQKVNEDDWRMCKFDEGMVWNEIQAHLEKLGAKEDKSGRRMRVAITNTGEILITSSILTKSSSQDKVEEPKLVRLDPIPIPVNQLKEFELISLRNKTGYRIMYDSARDRVKATLGMQIENQNQNYQDPCFDVLLQARDSENDVNFLTESSIANIIIVNKTNGLAYTPLHTSNHLQSPFLPGLMRQELIDSGLLREEFITVNKTKQLLKTGQTEMFLVNALRGTIPVKWIA